MKYILGSVTNKFENEKKTTYKLAMGYVSSILCKHRIASKSLNIKGYVHTTDIRCLYYYDIYIDR